MALVLNTEDNNTKVAKIPTFNRAATDADTVTSTFLLTEYKKTWQYLVQNRISFSVAFAAKSSKGRAALDIEAEGVKLFSKASEVWQ